MEKLNKYELNPAIKRFIKRKEKYLGRVCRMIWTYENRLGEKYMFANFCKNYDKLIVTIAHFNPNACLWLTPR